jgi:uncharacterized protein (TIGR02145 family)
MCHNLGANEAADPFTPAAEIHGAKYKWGVNRLALTQAQDQTSAYDLSVPNWDTITVPPITSDINWLTDNPCPPGWKVPSKTDWDNVLSSNTLYRTNNGGSSWVAGTQSGWTNSATNYSTGLKIGDALVLPAAGLRRYDDGSVLNRGYGGYYWCSSAYGSNSRNMGFNSVAQHTDTNGDRSYGFSVRCISE